MRSGEHSKYGLATIEKIATTLNCHFGGGYDIGCKFKKMLKHSILRLMLKEMGYQLLVGAFHDHEHRHLCQLLFLEIYTVGLGLEDSEGCKRWFSKSNHLATALQYASAFHQKQVLVTYAKQQDDLEMFANLLMFLLNNYKQALAVLETSPHFLTQYMDKLGIQDALEIESWPEMEQAFLSSLKEPETDTMHIEYHCSLTKLEDTKMALNIIKEK